MGPSEKAKSIAEETGLDARGMRLSEIDGVTVLEGEVGRRFYHKHKSPKARAKKKARRKLKKKHNH